MNICTFHNWIHFHFALPSLHPWRRKGSSLWYIDSCNALQPTAGHVTLLLMFLLQSGWTDSNMAPLGFCKRMGWVFFPIVPALRSVFGVFFGCTRMSGLWFHKVGYSYFWISFPSPQFFKNRVTIEFLLIFRVFSFHYLLCVSFALVTFLLKNCFHLLYWISLLDF